MKKCPNCGRPTARTEDWACQWCGYPLLSKSYRKMPQTYRELREERRYKAEPAVAAEAEISPLSPPDTSPPVIEVEPVPEPLEEVKPRPVVRKKTRRRARRRVEPKPEPEVTPEPVEESAAEAAVEAAPEPETEAAPETELEVVEIEPEPEAEVAPEAETQAVEEAKAEPEPEPDFGTEMESGAIKITVAGLSSAYQADKVGADERFKDKILCVTGTVDKVMVRDSLDIFYILLTGAGGKLLWNVRGTFDLEHGPELRRLAAGQSVTVQGKYAGYERNILLKDCTLVG